MLGTLIAALEVRQVKLDDDAIAAEAEGVNETRDGLPVLTAVRIRYRPRIPKGSRETVDRALARHQERCEAAATLRGAVEVSWSAEIEESG
jgi:organic hydroperoxide reductase OsmC/OhrA